MNAHGIGTARECILRGAYPKVYYTLEAMTCVARTAKAKEPMPCRCSTPNGRECQWETVTKNCAIPLPVSAVYIAIVQKLLTVPVAEWLPRDSYRPRDFSWYYGRHVKVEGSTPSRNTRLFAASIIFCSWVVWVMQRRLYVGGAFKPFFFYIPCPGDIWDGLTGKAGDGEACTVQLLRPAVSFKLIHRFGSLSICRVFECFGIRPKKTSARARPLENRV